jgi:hypothetical protein
MPITLAPNYLEYRINNKIVRYDIVRSRQHRFPMRMPRFPMLPRLRNIKRPLSYPSYPIVDKFRRKIK